MAFSDGHVPGHICLLSLGQSDDVTNKTGTNNEYSLVQWQQCDKDNLATCSIPQFIFVLYNHNNTWHRLTLCFSFHYITPFNLLVLDKFQHRGSFPEVSLMMSVWWCHETTGMLGITFDPRWHQIKIACLRMLHVCSPLNIEPCSRSSPLSSLFIAYNMQTQMGEAWEILSTHMNNTQGLPTRKGERVLCPKNSFCIPEWSHYYLLFSCKNINFQ